MAAIMKVVYESYQVIWQQTWFIKESFSVLMLCEPSNRRWPFSYTSSIFVFCPFFHKIGINSEKCIECNGSQIDKPLLSQSASEKHSQGKKPTYLCAPREFLKKMCLPCLINIKSCYIGYRINKPFACPNSRYVICVSCCSLDLYILRTQRIIGIF